MTELALKNLSYIPFYMQCIFLPLGFSSGDITQWTASPSAASTPKTGGEKPASCLIPVAAVGTITNLKKSPSPQSIIHCSPDFSLDSLLWPFACLSRWICASVHERRQVMVFVSMSAAAAWPAAPACVCMSESGLSLSLSLGFRWTNSDNTTVK